MAGVEATAVNRARKPDLIPGYRLESLLGRGGMGEVHKATQLSLNRTVAVKLLATELAKDPSFVTRFEKEAAALATLSHPNVVNIVDKGHQDQTWYLVMEYIDGSSLREIMRSPLLDTGSSLKMVYDICKGIEYAHSRGVIHRDLKPENILFDEQAGGIAKVTDFGLASFIEGENQARYNVTETHVSMGTVSYMAPEQRFDARKADHRADIYSLGVILYELLVGEVPVGNFDPPSVRKPGVNPKVDAIVARCLKQDPAERYSKVSDLMAELEPLAPVNMSVVRHAPSAARRLVTRVKKATRTSIRVVEGVAVLAALGVLGVSWARSQQQINSDPFRATALVKDLEAKGSFTQAGRLDKVGAERHLKLGDGPDQIPLLTFGRTVTLSEGALVSAADSKNPVGRFVPDVVDLDGDAVALTADVDAQPMDQGVVALVRRVVRGVAPDARAVVMLQGSPGRYVAVSIAKSGEPITVEWALGERRGVMLAVRTLDAKNPDAGRATLQLAIDEQGVARAFIGEGDDRRAVAEPIALGKDWRKQLGGAAKPALGCIDGTCRFKKVKYQVTSAAVTAPAVAATVTAPSVQKDPTPAPAPVVKASTTKTTTKKATTTPTAVKKKKGSR